MATAISLDLEQPAGTDIAVAVAQNPGIVLLDAEKFDVWYEKLKAKAPSDVDISTNKGRDKLRSFAAEVRSEKAAIDKARLRLTKEWRDMTAQANAAGKVIEERLESLAVEVRAPLTAWEEAEKARVAECRDVIDWFRQCRGISEDDTAASVRERGTEVYGKALDPEHFGDMLEEAQAAKAETIATLKRALDRLTKEEADRAELDRLRAEAAERERAEAEKREAEEAERQRVEAERLAEERRIAAEKAEQERIERVRQEAAAAAQREAEQAAQAERERVQREHEEALAAERAKAEEAERLRQAEADRIAAVERKREAEEAAQRAEEQRLADEQAKRERNRAHRAKIMGEAKVAIMAASNDGITEAVAILIVKAIVGDKIPHVSMEF